MEWEVEPQVEWEVKQWEVCQELLVECQVWEDNSEMDNWSEINDATSYIIIYNNKYFDLGNANSEI